MPEVWFYVPWLVGAYLVGSLSPGDLVSRAAGVNIRSMGTGNPGAANVFTEVGPTHGTAVFVLDVATGAVATFPLYLLDFPTWTRLLAALAVLGGHIFPLFWRFQGGVGGAVGTGAALGLLPLGVLIAAPATAVALAITRNPIYAVWPFFAITLLAGGLLHRDALGVIGVLLAASVPSIKWVIQQHVRSLTDARKVLGL